MNNAYFALFSMGARVGGLIQAADLMHLENRKYTNGLNSIFVMQIILSASSFAGITK